MSECQWLERNRDSGHYMMQLNMSIKIAIFNVLRGLCDVEVKDLGW